MCCSSPGYVPEVPVRRAVLALVLAALAAAGALAVATSASAGSDASSWSTGQRSDRASSWS